MAVANDHSTFEVGNEQRLSDILREFAGILLTDFRIQDTLDRLVVRIAAVLPVGSAGITLMSGAGESHRVAASNESAQRFVELQAETVQGPCQTAHRTGQVVEVPDLRAYDRFPEFTRRALEYGLRAVFSFPLKVEGRSLGVLDLFREESGPLDDEATANARTLADVAAAYLLNAETRAELKTSAQQAKHNSFHDDLTGLANRRLFADRLEHAMLRARRSGKLAAVFYADLDQFKAINDSFGHHVGDQLLVAVAERMRALIRPGDTLARLSGDEFAILCEDIDDASAVEPLAVRLGDSLAEPFFLAETEVSVTASVGIAFAGYGEDIPGRVLEEADAAMYQVKQSGGGRHAVIDLREHRSVNHRAQLNRDLRDALRRQELDVVYQPIVATDTGQPVGAEALLRWSHPTFGSVDREVLISSAEQSGAIIEIGQWLLEEACQATLRCQANGVRPSFGLSANVSVRQLMAAEYVASVASVLEATGINPAHVTLELTESALVYDETRALSILHALKGLGVKIAVDDFGTGLSSLSRLKQFPVDSIKLDREFITDLDRSLASRLIVGSVVDLAHGLGLTVVAEGIETAAQYHEAERIGCDGVQGFFVSRPQPCDVIAALASSPEPLATLDLDPS